MSQMMDGWSVDICIKMAVNLSYSRQLFLKRLPLRYFALCFAQTSHSVPKPCVCTTVAHHIRLVKVFNIIPSTHLQNKESICTADISSSHQPHSSHGRECDRQCDRRRSFACASWWRGCQFAFGHRLEKRNLNQDAARMGCWAPAMPGDEDAQSTVVRYTASTQPSDGISLDEPSSQDRNIIRLFPAWLAGDFAVLTPVSLQAVIYAEVDPTSSFAASHCCSSATLALLATVLFASCSLRLSDSRF